ncbi:hypothetical protein BOTBODRAFT_115259 [Botryobasidium botryosum FD-172 SS1]|uniref:Lysophospholipase n=1 Tax=Botryobasidium botryosum (strain FD-172 SS1) TaxID=930990 RepID=A0A067M7R3_BOTB1|nr:hypothetical protein BOTBODRAFT_115259 [Botryobasidium botryosum FD-172 SS1]
MPPPTKRSSFGIAAFAALNVLAGVDAQNVTTYAPISVTCPSGSFLRHAGTPQSNDQALHPDEATYVNSRKQLVQSALVNWLGDKASTVYGGNLASLSADQLPNLAISLSGGNFRAALFNAAALHAFDSRNSTSVSKGLGGLLQASTYMSALSGGSYTLTSLMFNEFPTLPDLVFGNNATGVSGWQLEQSLLSPGPSGAYSQAFFGHLYEDLGAKRAAGNFPVTFCDLWGRALAYHFFPGTSTPDAFTLNTTAGNHAAGLAYSSAVNLNTWKNHTMPFPIFIANVNSPNGKGTPFGSPNNLPLSNVVYEITPLEFGSYEPELASFIPMQYLGSTLQAGTPTSCVNSFDNVGLMIGTSSCDFHIFNITNDPAWVSPQGFAPLLSQITTLFGAYQPGQALDVASVPNPFLGVNVGVYQDANETALSLLDGSMDVENDPILPLLVKKRGVDVIVVLDSSGETSELKPDGLSLLATREKAALLPPGTINFPTPFPNTTAQFVSLGLNARPVFFGCDGAPNANDAFPYALSHNHAKIWFSF